MKARLTVIVCFPWNESFFIKASVFSSDKVLFKSCSKSDWKTKRQQKCLVKQMWHSKHPVCAVNWVNHPQCRCHCRRPPQSSLTNCPLRCPSVSVCLSGLLPLFSPIPYKQHILLPRVGWRYTDRLFKFNFQEFISKVPYSTSAFLGRKKHHRLRFIIRWLLHVLHHPVVCGSVGVTSASHCLFPVTVIFTNKSIINHESSVDLEIALKLRCGAF